VTATTPTEGSVAARPAPQWPAWTLGAVTVVGAFLLLGLLAEAFAPAPEGPAGSSFATSPAGVAAWAQLLRREGHPVAELRRPLADAALEPSTTLVILDATSLSPEAAARLRRFVRAGGRLVIGGGDSTPSLPSLVGQAPGFTAAGATSVHVVARVPEVAGVSTVRTAGAGAWTSAPGQVGLAGRRGALLLVQPRGAGRIDLLADPSPLENRLLASADNAQLALNLAGPPRTWVVFAEALHGFGLATGLAAIPARWWLTFAGLCLAAGAWALARGRRLGPPEPADPAPAPPRSAYVEALGTVLGRTRDRGALERALADREHASR
jgi:hypothetical protein